MKKRMQLLISAFLVITSVSSMVFADESSENKNEKISEGSPATSSTEVIGKQNNDQNDSFEDSKVESEINDATKDNHNDSQEGQNELENKNDELEGDLEQKKTDKDEKEQLVGDLEQKETDKDEKEELGEDKSDYNEDTDEDGETGIIYSDEEHLNNELNTEEGNENSSKITEPELRTLKTVKNLEEFWSAFNQNISPSVRQINLTQSITGNFLRPISGSNERTESIFINGNGYRLNIEFRNAGSYSGFILNEPPTDSMREFHLKNVTMSERNLAQLIQVNSSKWKIYLENVTLDDGLKIDYATNIEPSEVRINKTRGTLNGELKATRLFIEDQSKLVFGDANSSIIGSREINIDSSVIDGLNHYSDISRIKTHHLYVKNDSQINLKQGSSKTNPLIYIKNASHAAIFDVADSKVNLSTRSNSNAVVQFGSDNRYEGNHYSSKFLISGTDRSKHGVSITSQSLSDSLQTKALVNFAGVTNSSHSGDSQYNQMELRGAYFNVETKNNKALEFKVDNWNLGSKIEVHQGDFSIIDIANELDSSQAKIKASINSNLYIDVTQDGGNNGPGVMKIIKENKQNKKITSPFIDAGKIDLNLNSGFLDMNLGAKNANSIPNSTVPLISFRNEFKIRESKPFNKDEYGELRIISKNSPVIQGNGMLKIDLSEGSKILMEGSSDKEIIKIQNIQFQESTDNYTEFNNKGQGSILETTGFGTNNTFNIKSAVSLWSNGSDLNREPKLYSNPMKLSVDTVSLTGKNLNTIKESDRSDFTSKNYSTEGFAAYSKIVIESYKAITEDLIQPTDADKYIYGKILVRSGIEKETLRYPYENEVRVNIEETTASGTKRMHYGLVAQGMDTPSSELYPVYDKDSDEDKRGYFRLEIPGNKFAVAGSTYEIKDLYRYSDKIDNGLDVMGIHTRFYNENNGIEIKKHKTEDRTPPRVNPIIANGSVLSGTVSENGVKVSFAINGKKINDPLYLGNSRTWSKDFKSLGVKHGDEVQVFLEDSTGNINPIEDKIYHDATFNAGAKHKFIFIDYGLSSKNGFVSLKEFNNTEELILNRLDAVGKKVDNGIETSTPAIIKSLGGLNINDPKEGVYNITMTLKEDSSIESSAKLHIVDSDYLFQNSNYVIYGNDFYANNTDYKADSDRLVSKASMNAYNRDSLVKLDVIIHNNGIKETSDENPYDVVFKIKTNHPVKLTVKANVLDYDNVSENRDFVVAANDFKLMSYQVQFLNDEEIIKQASAISFRKKDLQKMNVKLIEHNIKQAPSVNYKASFGIEK